MSLMYMTLQDSLVFHSINSNNEMIMMLIMMMIMMMIIYNTTARHLGDEKEPKNSTMMLSLSNTISSFNSSLPSY